MSDEEAVDYDVATAEPSFRGRLQLKNFMFTGMDRISPAPRRGTQSQMSRASTASFSSRSTTPASETWATPSSPKTRATRKRKAQAYDPDPPPPPSSFKKSRRKGNGGGGGGGSGGGGGPPSSSSSLSSSPRKKRNAVPASYAPPSTYAHLPPLVDVLAPGLLILFIGLNPGLQTARTGHAYAHPSNLFWKLLYSSGITPVPCRPDEDRTLPARFALGNTNIVARPSRNGAELSRAEMDAGVAVLERKCRRWRPEAVCLVGKGIWESVFRVWHRRPIAKAEFHYGWQTRRMGAVPPRADSADVRIGVGDSNGGSSGGGGEDDDDDDNGGDSGAEGPGAEKGVGDGPWEGARIFVATSTSGLAASLRPEEKQRIWKILGDWCVQRRKERAEEKTEACA